MQLKVVAIQWDSTPHVIPMHLRIIPLQLSQEINHLTVVTTMGALTDLTAWTRDILETHLVKVLLLFIQLMHRTTPTRSTLGAFRLRHHHGEPPLQLDLTPMDHTTGVHLRTTASSIHAAGHQDPTLLAIRTV